MKTPILLVLLILMGHGFLSAQYRILKSTYDYTTWSRVKGDPYYPVLNGALSIIPGVGQMAAGELGRGLIFLGGSLSTMLVSAEGIAIAWGGNEDLGAGMYLIGIAGFAVLEVCSVIDATRVAKVRNLASRDQKMGINLRVKPIPTYGSTANTMGLSLAINF